MITKGFDFPGVTLVGVVLADLTLNLPDFRSAERTFQLLTQVAGRAGRGDKPGRVLIQTYAPHHYSVRAARDQDYARFMRRELDLRRELGYPPFGRMALVRIEGPAAAQVSALASRVAALLSRAAKPAALRILGPAPAPIERIKQRFRWQVVVKSPGSSSSARARRDAAETWTAKRCRRPRDDRCRSDQYDVKPSGAVKSYFCARSRQCRRRDLAHQVGDLVAIEAHREHGVTPALHRGKLEAFDGLVAAVGEQLGVTFDLTTENRAQARAEIRERVARAHHQAEDLAKDLRDFVARQIIGGGDDKILQRVFHVHRKTITACRRCGNSWNFARGADCR